MSDCEIAARVGYALEPKKIQSFIQPSLLNYTKQHNINLVQIDPTKPLTEQGSFHCIIHKLHTQQWKTQLHEFSTKNPNTIIIDPPELVDRLHNRVTMLESVTQLQVVTVPNQLVVTDPKSFDFEGFRFPIIAKPLEANGTAGSHELRLVFDRDGVNALTTPIVLQEFVNHGGVVFKIYVAGHRVNCVKRKSLGDISMEKLKTLKGSLTFSQVSNLSVEEGEEGGGVVDEAVMPPQSLIDELAKGLREALGLNLFNVDVIRDSNDPSRYLVIDINYFPGYAKLPSYESFFTGFLLDIVQQTKTC